MFSKETPYGVIQAANNSFWSRTGIHASDIAQRMRDEPMFAMRIALAATYGDAIPLDSEKRAREIMGSNFLGVREAQFIFGDWKASTEIGPIPFPETVLQVFQHTHLLYADLGISLNHIIGTVGMDSFLGAEWFTSESFARAESKPQWRLIQRDSRRADSYRRNPDHVTSVRSGVSAAIAFHMLNGSRHFGGHWNLCGPNKFNVGSSFIAFKWREKRIEVDHQSPMTPHSRFLLEQH